MMPSQTCAHGYCGVDLQCELLTSYVDDYDHMRYTTYGVRVIDENGNVVFECKDISTEKEVVLDFIVQCETSMVSAVHLMDVLEDLLP